MGIVGDSVARSLYPGFAAAGKKHHYTTASAALAGCAVGDQMRVEEDGKLSRQTERCVHEAPDLQDQLVRTYDPDVIYWYPGRDRYDIRSGDTTLQAESPEWRAAAFADWDRTLARLRARGAEVRVVCRSSTRAPIRRTVCSRPTWRSRAARSPSRTARSARSTRSGRPTTPTI